MRNEHGVPGMRAVFDGVRDYSPGTVTSQWYDKCVNPSLHTLSVALHLRVLLDLYYKSPVLINPEETWDFSNSYNTVPTIFFKHKK